MDADPGTDMMRAFLDESSRVLDDEFQEYLIGAALLSSADCADAREELRPLLLPGQVKLHWTDESRRRRSKIIDAIVSLGPMNAIISHVSARQRRTERSGANASRRCTTSSRPWKCMTCCSRAAV